MQVNTTISVEVPDSTSLDEVEQVLADELRKAGQRLLVALCRDLESDVLARAGSSLRSDHRRARHLLTRFGWVRLERWQVRERDTGRYAYPLDRALGLEPRQRASRWVVDAARALAARLPYRQATELLDSLLDVPVDHRTVHGWVHGDPRWLAARSLRPTPSRSFLRIS
jgi:hypothetical protein